MNLPENNQTWSFIHVSDIHVGSPRSYRFQPAWNENWQTARNQIAALNPELLLVGGDLTRDGATHVEELESIQYDLAQLSCESLVIPGNHEAENKWSPDSSVAINSSNLRRYAKVFGPSEWSVVRGSGDNLVRFTGMDAFKLGSGLPEEGALRRWLEVQSQEPAAPHHVWVVHPALFTGSFDEPDIDRKQDRVAWYFGLNRTERRYLWDVMKATGVTYVISGHIHCRRQVLYDGVQFHLAPATAFPQWSNRWSDGDDTLGVLRFEVARGQINSEFVPLGKTSGLKGYGPGGESSAGRKRLFGGIGKTAHLAG